MTSFPLLITRNKHNNLFEAIAASLITIFLLYGALTNFDNSTLGSRFYILLVIFCVVGSIILWYKFFQKDQLLIKITETSISFKKNEVEWNTISSYRITEYTPSDGSTSRHIFIKLKDKQDEMKFYLPEYDISLEFLLKVFDSFAQIHKFSFLGISEK